MLDGIPQGFLGDAVEAQRSIRGQSCGHVSTPVSDPHSVGRFENRSHSDWSAAFRPRSSRIEGWSWREIRCTSSAIPASSSVKSPTNLLAGFELARSCFSFPAPIAVPANRWETLSCSSRASRLRSFSGDQQFPF